MIRSIVTVVAGLCASAAFANTNGNCVFELWNENFCIHTTNFDANETLEIIKSCEDKKEGLGGVWTAETECSAESRIAGTCSLNNDPSKDVLLFFYEPMTTERAQEFCKGTEGVWIP